MERKELIEKYKVEIKNGFDDWFRTSILNGRPELLADVTLRTYPYTDLIDSYSNGIIVAIRILEKELNND